uniref:Copper transport protein n=1 Tax=Picea sitchensis TaxID=3332 RepID=A9NYF4_PICSI|nr:unknown [Picea sitchensis]
MMMMHMTFYWGKEVSILFDGWRTQTLMQYWASLLVLFLASVFHEYVVSIRAHIRMSYNNIHSSQENSYNSMGSPQPQAKSMLLLPTKAKTRGYVIKTAETLLFGVNALLGYLLMLAAMSYNGGVVLAIVGGLSVGFFSFRSVGNFNVVNIHHQEEDEEDLHLSADPCSSCT